MNASYYLIIDRENWFRDQFGNKSIFITNFDIFLIYLIKQGTKTYLPVDLLAGRRRFNKLNKPTSRIEREKMAFQLLMPEYRRCTRALLSRAARKE